MHLCVHVCTCVGGGGRGADCWGGLESAISRVQVSSVTKELWCSILRV